MKTQLALDALALASWQRRPSKGLVHYADRGSQYACHDDRQRLETYGMEASMSRKGTGWDNAPTERFFRSLKSERLTACRVITRNEAKMEILDYITFYNSLRLHSPLGDLSPMAYEKEQFFNVA